MKKILQGLKTKTLRTKTKSSIFAGLNKKILQELKAISDICKDKKRHLSHL